MARRPGLLSVARRHAAAKVNGVELVRALGPAEGAVVCASPIHGLTTSALASASVLNRIEFSWGRVQPFGEEFGESSMRVWVG